MERLQSNNPDSLPIQKSREVKEDIDTSFVDMYTEVWYESDEKRYARESVEEGERRKVFENQFTEPEIVQFRGADYEVIDIAPTHETSPVPILFVPGYGKTPRTYMTALYELHKAGRRVIAVTAPLKDVELQSREKKDDVPDVQVMRALAIVHVLEHKNIEKADLFSHSEGGMNSLIAGSIDDSRIRNMMLAAPVGLTEPVSWIDIAKRFVENQREIKKATKEESPEIVARYKASVEEAGKYAGGRSNNKILSIIKATYESGKVGTLSVVKMAEKLKERRHGISIIAGENDKMLPLKEFQTKPELEFDPTSHKLVRKKRSLDELGKIDHLYKIKGGHSDLHINGQSGRIAIEGLIELDEKYGDDDMSYVKMARNESTDEKDK